MIDKKTLDGYYEMFCSQPDAMDGFLEVDPLGIVYELKQHTDNQLNIELGALFVAMLSWGNRKAIRKAARHLLGDVMEWKPSEHIFYERFRTALKDDDCVYRTLDGIHFKYVCQNILIALDGSGDESLEEYFDLASHDDIVRVVSNWFTPANCGTPYKSACKRVNMWLRWMTRSGKPDLGLWKSRSENELYAVMDTHVMQLTAPLLQHKTASWKSMQELTTIFREWDPNDPLKYDVALMVYADNNK